MGIPRFDAWITHDPSQDFHCPFNEECDTCKYAGADDTCNYEEPWDTTTQEGGHHE